MDTVEQPDCFCDLADAVLWKWYTNPILQGCIPYCAEADEEGQVETSDESQVGFGEVTCPNPDRAIFDDIGDSITSLTSDGSIGDVTLLLTVYANDYSTISKVRCELKKWLRCHFTLECGQVCGLRYASSSYTKQDYQYILRVQFQATTAN